MPTLLQRAETFVVNCQNPVAKALVEELMARIVELDSAIHAAGEAGAMVDLELAKRVRSPAAFITAYAEKRTRLDAIGSEGGKATVETR
jgi:hypothetical protein